MMNTILYEQSMNMFRFRQVKPEDVIDLTEMTSDRSELWSEMVVSCGHQITVL